MSNKKIRFILNPKAGRGFNNKMTALAVKSFSPNLFDVEILYSQFPLHAVELSKKAADNKYDIVVAVGGDGTVNEVAQSLKNSDTALAIIPTGSGNGFARHFKIPLQIEKAIEIIKRGKIMNVDSLLINGKFCMNIAGTGFDAYIASLFADHGKRGFTTYSKLVIKKYFSYKEKNYTVEYDNKKINTGAFLIAIANASQFGNNAQIAPLARPDNGMMDTIILKKIPLWKIPLMVTALFTGQLRNSAHVEMIKSNSFTIESDEEMFMQIDGEPNDSYKKITAEVVPKSIQLIVP